MKFAAFLMYELNCCNVQVVRKLVEKLKLESFTLTRRGVRERFALLLKKFRAGDRENINK